MANQIRKLRKERDMTLDALAEATGISNSYLSRMEVGKRNVSLENVIAIANALGVDGSEVSDEYSNEDIQAATSLAPSKPKGDIPNIDILAGMGDGGLLAITVDGSGKPAPEFVKGYWSFPEEVLAKWMHQSKTYAFRVDGDSMDPTLIGGSFVFVDTTQKFPNPPDIYVIDDGDGLMVKRVALIPKTDKVLIMSDNDRYPDRELRRNDIEVWGRVVASFQWRG